MLGAQYCSSTHCQYEELQLEPSAFQAVRTYASTGTETSTGELEELGVGKLAGLGAGELAELGVEVAAASKFAAPPSITTLFGLQMFGLTPPTPMHSGIAAEEPEIEAGEKGDAILAELDPGEGESEASNMLVPVETVEMA